MNSTNKVSTSSNSLAATAGKGLLVGGTMLVPGVSGGSMAMILGIYSHLISAVSGFRTNIKTNALFLFTFCAGGGLGIIFFANPILRLIEQYPLPMSYLFTGAVAGGIPLIFKQAKIKKWHVKTPAYILLGLFIVLAFSSIPKGFFTPGTGTALTDSICLIPTGIFAAVALVLPGISVSYLLLLMGLYDKTMSAISSFDLSFLVPLGIGLTAGILLTTKLLGKLMTYCPQPTYLVILGFVLGSVKEIFPGLPKGNSIFGCILLFVMGFFIIQVLSWSELRDFQTTACSSQHKS